jgi:long-subunit fatty acid transport protein
MNKTLCAVSVMTMAAGAAQAGGIDRSGQGLGALFETGRYLELSFGAVNPTVSGNDVAVFGGGATGNVTDNFNQLALSYKYDINDDWSFALVIDQPFGADVSYDATSVALGGTTATASATAVTGLLRYKINENFSVHGGLRAQKAKANVDLRGAAYRSPLTPTVPGSGFDGYSVALSSDVSPGFVLGVAYEKPEIALRVALTYNSEVKHEFDTIETMGGGAVVVGTTPTTVRTPQSVNLDFQTGVAKNTLVFGQIRWADWSAFKLDPAFFTARTGSGLINLDDWFTYTIGVGRKFNDNWSGSFSLQYEEEGNPLVSPLAPTTGRIGATLAAVYTRDNMKVTAGINYTDLGQATPETGTPDVARARMQGSHAVSLGLRVGFRF